MTLPLEAPPLTARGTRDARIRHAESLADVGRYPEAEATLRAMIAEAPQQGDAYDALALILMNAGRDLDALQVCASMLAQAPGVATYLAAAQLLLFLHRRHELLITRQAEPVRLDFRAIGVPDVAPMLLAPDLLARALQLARVAAAQTPRSARAHLIHAECELRSGFPRAARKAAERAATCERSSDTLAGQACTAFADNREKEAATLLRQLPPSALTPSLTSGETLSLRTDPAFAPSTIAADQQRTPWVIPYAVEYAGQSHARTVTVRTGPSEVRCVREGRVVGGLFVPVDPSGRAYVHGVVDEPDITFATPSFAQVQQQRSARRNAVLAAADDGRLLLHSPRGERIHAGRAFLLSSNFGSNYYHWIADVLGGLSAAPEAIDDPTVRFVVSAPLHPFQVETLGWMGIALERLVQVAEDEIARFDELIIVHHRKDGGCTDAGVWRWLRERLAQPDAARASAPASVPRLGRRLYLRRSQSVMRRLLNDDLAASICREHGFESVDTATMTVEAQRALFGEATMVVAPVGAALTNLLFSPAGAQLVLFGQRGYVVPCYNALAESMGHTVRYVLGTEQQSRFPYPHWDYHVDERELRSALAQALDSESR